MVAPRSWRCFCVIFLSLVLGIGLGSTRAHADAQHDAFEAATLLHTWRFSEAREQVKQLISEHPNLASTRYLRAEIDFYEGNYSQVLEGLKGLEDGAVDGNVGALRSLAASSYSVTKGFSEHSSSEGHFRIFYAPGKDQVLAQLAGDVLESAFQALGSDLGHHPSEPIRVEILGNPSDLAMVSTLTEEEIKTTGTIALCKYGKLMVVSPRATLFGYPWMDTLTHEYVHYVVTQISRDQVPVWLHEGLARFLQVRWRGPAQGKLGKFDRHLLAKALKNDSLITFEAMYPSMAKLPSQEAAALAFAEVSTLVGYLRSKVGNAGLQEVLSLIRQGKGARKSVAQVLGSKWSTLEKSWKQYLRRTIPPNESYSGRSPKIRFRQGEGSADNVGIDTIKNKRARKLTRLGGMLRAQGHAKAAAIEYEKALRLGGPTDPLIAAKLSRIYLHLDRFQDALTLAEPLLAGSDGDPAPATTVGAARLALQDYAGASEAFELALRISPFDTRVRCGLAESYEHQERRKAARRERRACEYLQQVR